MILRNIQRSVVGLACVIGVSVALAADRPLPPLTLTDDKGDAVTERDLVLPSAWAILVIDADKHLSTEVLPRFQKKTGDWDGKLVIVSVGNEAALAALRARHSSKLSGTRWYRDASGQLLKRLAISGTPTLLGLRANGAIAWTIAAIPEKPESVQSLVVNWIAQQAPPQ